MRAVFYVFSGTGNTRRVSEKLAKEWCALGHEAVLADIRVNGEYPDPADFDVVVVGYPVHGFNAPTSVLKFLKSLPKRKGERRPAYLVRSSGEPLRLNDASGITPRRILKKRGFEILGEFHFVMPYNIIFRHSDGMAARMWQDAELLAGEYARTMSGLERKKTGVNVFKRMAAFCVRIEHTAMPFIGHHFKATKSCAGCGACAKLCPQGNITMKDGKPKFARACVGCMACAFGCPKDAIKTGVLNSWRVNGAYTFEGAPATDREVCRYCRKSYLRYFHNAEKNMEEHNESSAH